MKNCLLSRESVIYIYRKWIFKFFYLYFCSNGILFFNQISHYIPGNQSHRASRGYSWEGSLLSGRSPRVKNKTAGQSTWRWALLRLINVLCYAVGIQEWKLAYCRGRVLTRNANGPLRLYGWYFLELWDERILRHGMKVCLNGTNLSFSVYLFIYFFFFVLQFTHSYSVCLLLIISTWVMCLQDWISNWLFCSRKYLSS